MHFGLAVGLGHLIVAVDDAREMPNGIVVGPVYFVAAELNTDFG